MNDLIGKSRSFLGRVNGQKGDYNFPFFDSPGMIITGLQSFFNGLAALVAAAAAANLASSGQRNGHSLVCVGVEKRDTNERIAQAYEIFFSFSLSLLFSTCEQVRVL